MSKNADFRMSQLRPSRRAAASLTLILVLFVNALPCGPGYITPLFDYTSAPENPYENFAAGRLGIIKPAFHRSVLLAAYRYINGGWFTAAEQKALTEVWRAEYDNKDYRDDRINDAVNTWIEKRKDVTGKDEKTPDIYTDRGYGGYDSFPNCTANAFETATGTLADRIASYGSDNKDVKLWLEGQDRVFQNCTSGKVAPLAADPSMPQWLQKDRVYQIAAAAFYSLEYESAKAQFDEISRDTDSVWQETANYLVARTLIRQASLSKSPEKATKYYLDAEQRLDNIGSAGGKFAESSEGLLGLVKFRLDPEGRVGELARKLGLQSGDSNFRQDVIDYSWLLDKFEKEALEKEEKRKQAEKPVEANTAKSNNFNTSVNANAVSTPSHDEGDLQIYLYSPDFQKSWTFYVKADATDEEAIAEAEQVSGQPLTEDMKKSVRESRRSAYASRFSNGRQQDYPGRYYGSEQISISLLPQFLRRDEMTDWLFAFQINNPEAYLYVLSRFRSSGSDLWLMTALAKADKNSAHLDLLLEAARRATKSSAAYSTITYHHCRLLLETGRNAEAKSLIDSILNSPDEMSISARNQFLALRLTLAETLDDFLRYSLRRPFAFDFDGSTGTIEELIAQEKQWYDPVNSKQTREEYDQEIEERYREERLWQDRLMFDFDTIETINQHFPLSVLAQVERSPAIPDYLRGKFALAIWTRASLLGNHTLADRLAPELLRSHPEFDELLIRVTTARTPAARENALLYFILKNPVLSPYVEDGVGKTDNEIGSFDANDWWCAPYEPDNEGTDGNEYAYKRPGKPSFLLLAQSLAAQGERKRLKDLGDAPKFLGNRVLAWARRAPTDRRIPESLYIVYQANGWTKYGCGNDEEFRNQIGDILKQRYAGNEWTEKMLREDAEQ